MQKQDTESIKHHMYAADSEDNYIEETGTEQHDVPASLPDVDIYEEDTPPTDEEYIEAAKIMMGEV